MTSITEWNKTSFQECTNQFLRVHSHFQDSWGRGLSFDAKKNYNRKFSCKYLFDTYVKGIMKLLAMVTYEEKLEGASSILGQGCYTSNVEK